MINLILSVALIPSLGIYGAIIGTCAAELFGCVFQIFISRKFLSPIKVIKILVSFGLIGLAVFFGIKLVSLYLDQGIVSLLIQFAVGALIFILLSALYLY